jgi:non-ribosomal peptide synthetase component F
VDAHLRPQPPGAAGELVVCGPTVGDGYVGVAHSDAFPAGLFDRHLAAGSAPDADLLRRAVHRCYRTGDIARLDDDGNLLYLGRRDSQARLCFWGPR